MCSQREKILVADDEASVAQTLTRLLQREGYDVKTAKNGTEAVTALDGENYDLAILDMKMPHLDGLAAFEQIKVMHPEMPVIFMTAYGNINLAVAAMRQGAFDYIPKPFNVDAMLMTVKKALSMNHMAVTVTRLSQEVDKLRNEVRECLSMDQIIGKSHPMQELFKQIAMVSQANSTVLLRGESGVGKELIAKAIHYHSDRRACPLIKVNCAAIPETLLESELFGHEKGAFTGAVTSKPGKFELADTGTIFLDEIGDLSPLMQVKLLRVLQDRKIDRVGSLKPVDVDVQIIAATNADLERGMAEGLFREDLYYRLKVIEIRVPSLRERPDDILLLAEYFLMKYSEETGRKSLFFTEETRQALQKYNWPGNVRELENVIERAVVMGTGKWIHPENLSFQNPKPASTIHDLVLPESILLGSSLKELLAAVERMAVSAALEKTGGNKAQAARLLDISRRSLQYKVDEYRLSQSKESMLKLSE